MEHARKRPALWLRVLLGLFCVAVSVPLLLGSAFLAAFSTVDCIGSFAPPGECNESTNFGEWLVILLIPPTVTAVPLMFAGLLAGLSWRWSLATAWLVSFAMLLLVGAGLLVFDS